MKKLVKPVRNSTASTYNSFYDSFVKFILQRNGVNKFPLSEVIEFFNSLANKGFKSTTLKSVRSILKDPLVFYFPDYNILLDPWIIKIIKFVKSTNVQPRFNFPSWNLDLVIRMLKVRNETNMDYIFKKTLFIVFLACPYRISEFNAISLSNSSFSSLHALLRSHIAFRSKNQTDSFSPSPIVIQNFPEEPSICPVSLLNKYINLTKALCRDKNIDRPDRLWINTSLKPASLFTLRNWVKEIIFLADPNADPTIRVHSIRSQVASHLLAYGFSVKEIMASMNWKSSSTFTKYYARLGIQTAVKAVLAGHPTC